ncbi:hypothetical protein, partial [Serratia marcescens]
ITAPDAKKPAGYHPGGLFLSSLASALHGHDSRFFATRFISNPRVSEPDNATGNGFKPRI